MRRSRSSGLLVNVGKPLATSETVAPEGFSRKKFFLTEADWERVRIDADFCTAASTKFVNCRIYIVTNHARTARTGFRSTARTTGRASLLVGRASLPAYQSATELANQSDGCTCELRVPSCPPKPLAVVYNVTSDHRNQSVAQISSDCQSTSDGNSNFQ